MDLIDRQAAIDLYKRDYEGRYAIINAEQFEAMLTRVTSAQTEIICCKDCKHWTDENGGLCDIWDHYISNEEFFCGCGERREADDH